MKSAHKYFDMALDIVSDILLEPLFKKDEIEKELAKLKQQVENRDK